MNVPLLHLIVPRLLEDYPNHCEHSTNPEKQNLWKYVPNIRVAGSIRKKNPHAINYKKLSGIANLTV